MRNKLILILLLFIASGKYLAAQEISRVEIQNYFEQTPNAIYMPFWETRFLNKNINWTGKIFSLEYQKDFNRTEIALKVLPYTKMYDTIVYVPGDISDKYHENDEVPFSGAITRGVDMLGVKEVQVSVGKNMGDHFGDYIFSENGIMNVNFTK